MQNNEIISLSEETYSFMKGGRNYKESCFENENFSEYVEMSAEMGYSVFG